MSQPTNNQFVKYVLELWYKDVKYEGTDLEMIDNEEISQIAKELEKILQLDRNKFYFDFEDLHIWYLFVDSNVTIPDERQTFSIRPFPKYESLFEENAEGQCEIQIQFHKE